MNEENLRAKIINIFDTCIQRITIIKHVYLQT